MITRKAHSAKPMSNVACADTLKVLAENTRLHVMRRLLQGPRSVAELNTALGLEQSLLSHHLRALRKAGLVISERVGKGVSYRLAPEVALSSDDDTLDLGCCALSFNSPANVSGKTIRRNH